MTKVSRKMIVAVAVFVIGLGVSLSGIGAEISDANAKNITAYSSSAQTRWVEVANGRFTRSDCIWDGYDGNVLDGFIHGCNGNGEISLNKNLARELARTAFPSTMINYRVTVHNLRTDDKMSSLHIKVGTDSEENMPSKSGAVLTSADFKKTVTHCSELNLLASSDGECFSELGWFYAGEVKTQEFSGTSAGLDVGNEDLYVQGWAGYRRDINVDVKLEVLETTTDATSNGYIGCYSGHNPGCYLKNVSSNYRYFRVHYEQGQAEDLNVAILAPGALYKLNDNVENVSLYARDYGYICDPGATPVTPTRCSNFKETVWGPKDEEQLVDQS